MMTFLAETPNAQFGCIRVGATVAQSCLCCYGVIMECHHMAKPGDMLEKANAHAGLCRDTPLGNCQTFPNNVTVKFSIRSRGCTAASDGNKNLWTRSKRGSV